MILDRVNRPEGWLPEASIMKFIGGEGLPLAYCVWHLHLRAARIPRAPSPPQTRVDREFALLQHGGNKR